MLCVRTKTEILPIQERRRKGILTRPQPLTPVHIPTYPRRSVGKRESPGSHALRGNENTDTAYTGT